MILPTEEIVMSKPSAINPFEKYIDIPPVVHLWILRILIPLGMHKEFIDSYEFSDDSIAEMLGLSEWVNVEPDIFNVKAVRSHLLKMYKFNSRKLSGCQIPSTLHENVMHLAKIVGLSQTDCRILEFAVMVQNENLLGNAIDWFGQTSFVKAGHILSVLLDLPEQDIRASLSTQSVLAKTGLVSFDKSNYGSLREKLTLLSGGFATQISASDTDPVSLLRDMVTLASPPELDITDYEHIAHLLSVLRPYLKHSVLSGKKGVNIFLYGAPGTGKSQLAKVLAGELDCKLFEVTSEDQDGDPVGGIRRLRAYRAAQSFFSKQRTIILFDEVEDVFNDGSEAVSRKNTAQISKAWMNRMLEENSIPTLWLSNSVDSLDPAFIRRFDMIFELSVPPKKQRERIIKEVCGDLIDSTSLARISQSETLAPAVVTRAASVIRSIRDELNEAESSSAIELLINNTLALQGHSPIQTNDRNMLPEIYDPAFIHADVDLASIAAGLMHSKSGRLCLYGPPGTGKTAYGRWLADQMGIPLIVKRASDLMSMWVGGNEKNIAKAFKEAQEESALLLIDEVDSFLQDRRGAQRAWEASLVNEMLTQMESFSGIFIASTNLMDGLDQAALRRFDLKVKFGFLKSEQAWRLLGRHCLKLSLSCSLRKHKDKLNQLKNLTPGDFAAVARQNTFRPITSCVAFITALEQECTLKENITASIGFLQ